MLWWEEFRNGSISRSLGPLATKSKRFFKRPPDYVVGKPDDPYLLRWWVIPRNPFFNVYLHQFLKDDESPDYHDHPWFNITVVLRGRYLEFVKGKGVFSRRAGHVVFRLPSTAHRILTCHDVGERKPVETITLFITGPRVRQWGFFCGERWVPWQRYTDPKNPGIRGRGCNEDNLIQ